MDKELEKILASCLEALQQGESLEHCLSQYPHRAGELGPLLRAAVLVRQSTHLEARPEFKAATRSRLMASLRASQPAFFRRGGFGWRWMVTVASVLVVILGGGTVALAQNSLPDQPLYPVKIAVEEARLALTPGKVSKARLEMELAGQRTYEITELGKKNRPKGIERASRRLASHIERFGYLAASQEEAHTQARNELEAILERRAAQHQAALERALAEVPESSARPALRRDLERANASYLEARRQIRRTKNGSPQKINGQEVPATREPAEENTQP